MSSYNPKKIEKKWQNYWDEKGFFKAEDQSEKEKYYALVEFPYPSGSGLHLGHCFNYVLLDFFARKKRMEGKNVLSPIGWDAFGLPTENFAIRTGIHPREATKKNTDNFRRQMKNLGLGFNWDREINTTDPGYYKWTQWIFREMFKHGLAYKEKMDINWCPSCKIGLANEEVINGTCERCGAEVEQRKISQWLLKITAYADRLIDELDLVDFDESIVSAQRNWIGRSRGAKIDFPLASKEGAISVFTTRPDTLGGATFFVLAPEHPKVFELTTDENKKRVEKYVEEAKNKMDLERKSQDREKTGVPTGGFVRNPLTGEEIPVFVADYVMMDYGTGALMGVPAHDERDFAFAKKHGLEIREVIKHDSETEKKCFSGEGKVINTEGYNGMNSKDAGEKIVQDLEERGLASKAVDYHLRDWIFSRQHYWGEPIPMVYCEKCAKEGKTYWDVCDFEPNFSPSEDLAGWFPISKRELPLELPEVENYEPTDTGESPLAEMKGWVEAKCPHCGGVAERETDTMPNWAGSSWYYLRYCDPGNDEDLADIEKLEHWMPVDIYIGGAEHTTLHLLYSRFWHKFLNDIGKVPGKEPYLRRRNRGLILGEDHRKMSKSKGNYILPGEIIEKYGADALRTYLAFIGPYDGTFPWQDSGIRGVFRFLSRLYSFAEEKLEKKEETEKDLKRKLHRLIRDVGEDIEEMKFNTAVAKMMEFLNEAEGEKFSLKDLKNLLKLIAPFAPHLAEEFWSEIGKKESIHKSSWPSYSEKMAQKKETTLIIQVDGKVRGRVKAEAGLSEEDAEKKALREKRVKKWLKGKKVKKTVYVPDKLINFVTD